LLLCAIDDTYATVVPLLAGQGMGFWLDNNDANQASDGTRC